MENSSNVKRILVSKLPWVKTSEELRALEKKSALWYVVTVPLRILNALDWSVSKRGVGLLPIALLALLVIYLFK